MVLQLPDDKLIGNGASRWCYEHPHNPDLCVKIPKKPKHVHHLHHEITAYKRVKNVLAPHVVYYDENLVQTDKGLGLVTGLLRDKDGKISKSLEALCLDNSVTPAMVTLLEEFLQNKILKNRLKFYDFNPRNFIFQNGDDGWHLYFIDLKSWNKFKPYTFLRTEKISTTVSTHLVKRRMRKLFTSRTGLTLPSFLKS